MDNLKTYLDIFLNFIITYTPSFILAIGVLLIGLWLIKRITKLIQIALLNSGLPSDIIPSLSSFFNLSLKILLVFIVAGLVGIETASFVAILAAAGFAVGMALQGSLGNFAAGVIILLFKPYRIGDWVEVQEKFGQVEEIQIFHTLMVTPGSKTIVIPNGQVIENVVTNFSSKGHIRLELEVTMPYAESFPKVRRVILETLKEIPYILQDPEPQVGITTYESHSIVVTIRPFVKPEDYWEVTFAVYEKIKYAFSVNGIKVAYSEGVEMGTIGE